MAAVRLGLREILVRWRSAAAMSLILALPVMMFLLLRGYQNGLNRRYEPQQSSLLLVQEAGSMGEFYGSRLPANLKTQLQKSGASTISAELHTITGTSTENAVLLRGVELDKYRSTEDFQVVEGRPLEAGDSKRQAMCGIKLAEERNAYTGGEIELRGRKFIVTGVFSNGTYADYEAWISLEAAQELMGWGSDVSVFIIPEGEGLKEGGSLQGGAVVVKKGESGQNLIDEWRPFFRLFNTIILTLAIAAAVVLSNIIWRMAWQRRRDIAVLQSIGFRKAALLAYLVIQAVTICAAGMVIGIFGAIIIGNLFQLRTAGISIDDVIDLKTIISAMVIAGTIAFIASALPANWFTHQNLVELMKAEE